MKMAFGPAAVFVFVSDFDFCSFDSGQGFT